MKILKSIMLGLSMLVICTAAKADPKPTKMQVLDIFMDAAAHGKVDGLAKVLDNELEYNTKRGNQTITSTKDQLLKYFNATKDIEQNCKCSSSVAEENERYTIMKVEMKYDTYTRVNMVTIKDTASGWMITRVETSVVNNA